MNVRERARRIYRAVRRPVSGQAAEALRSLLNDGKITPTVYARRMRLLPPWDTLTDAWTTDPADPLFREFAGPMPVAVGDPVLLFARSKETGRRFWQRGQEVMTTLVLANDTPSVFVAWSAEVKAAHNEGRPPQAEPWPSWLVVPDPNPPEAVRIGGNA